MAGVINPNEAIARPERSQVEQNFQFICDALHYSE
jgi:hypothetical protein